MNKKNINIIKGIIFIALAIYLAFTFENALFNLVSKAPFGWVISSIVLRAMISLAFARGFQLIIKAIFPKIKAILVFIVGVFIGFGVSFISPIYNVDYVDDNYTSLELNMEEVDLNTNHQIKHEDKTIIIAFFTTDCPHCKLTSEKLGVMANANKAPQIYAFFPGEKKDVENFISKHNGKNFKSIIIENQSFFVNASGGAFPSVFLINKKGETIKHWNGELSYPALDFIISHQ